MADDYTDDELLTMARAYGIKTKTPKQPEYSDDELLAMAQEYGIKTKPRQEPGEAELLAMAKQRGLVVSKPAPPAQKGLKPFNPVGDVMLGAADALGGATNWLGDRGFDLNAALAPARAAREQQQQLEGWDLIAGKGAAAARGALDLAEIPVNLALATHKDRAHANPLELAAKGVLDAGKDWLDNTPVAKKAPQFYKQYADTAAMLAPLPNMSVASLIPKWNAAVKAGKIIPAIADSAAVGGGIAGAASASGQYDETGKIDPLTTMLSAGLGAGLGGGIGTLAHSPQIMNAAMKALKPKPKALIPVKAEPAPKTEQEWLDDIVDRVNNPRPKQEAVPETLSGHVSTSESEQAAKRLEYLRSQGYIDPTDPEQAAIMQIRQQIWKDAQAASRKPRQNSQPARPEPVAAEELNMKETIQEPDTRAAEPEMPLPSEPAEEGIFRYSRPDDEHLGYERAELFTDLDQIPVPLERIDRIAFRRLAEAGANQKYKQQIFNSKLAEFARKHGDPEWMFNDLGLKGGIDLEANIGREAEQSLQLLRHELATGVYDKSKGGIRGLSEAGYDQGRDWLPAELPRVSDDKIKAAADLVNTRRNYLEAQAEFKALKDLHKDKVLNVQERLREASPAQEGQPPEQLKILLDTQHPAGAEYGRVKYGIETFQDSMGLKLPPEAEARVKARRQQLEAEAVGAVNGKDGLTKLDWKELLKKADAELASDTGLAPMHEVQNRALDIARANGWILKGAPYKLNLKLSNWTKAHSKVLETAIEQRGARGSMLALTAGILSQLDQEAEAANGKKHKDHKVNLTWPMLAVGAVVAAVAGGRRLKGAMRTKAFLHAGNLWRDTMDMVQALDKHILAANPKQQENIFSTVWQHMANMTRSSWGVKFDNPEQLMTAIREFKAGQPGAAFNALAPEQKAAISDQALIKRSLAKKVETYIKEVEAQIEAGNLKGDNWEVQSGLDALRHMRTALNPAPQNDTAMGRAGAHVLGNIMDSFFFWNPEHHITNLTDQWIAGGSRVGVHNIAKANMLLLSDKELRTAFENSNLIGGMRVERAEQRAITETGKALTPFQKLMNTDIPSDKWNADRVALGSLLEYAQLNRASIRNAGYKSDTDFAKAILNGSADPLSAMDAWVHMTERVSRTLGVDPLRLNGDLAAMTPFVKNIMVFYKQPARLSRLMVNYIGTGNIAGLFTLMGATAVFGGRAAIPAELASAWSQYDPNSYFQIASMLDRTSAYQNIAHENNSGKLGYGFFFPATAGFNLPVEMISKASESMNKLLEALNATTTAKGKAQTQKAWDKVAQESWNAAVKVSQLVAPRVAGVPVRLANKIKQNTEAAANDELKVNFWEKGGNRPYAKAKTIQPSKIGISPFDFAKDVIMPGTPEKIDQLQMSELERAKKRKIKKGRPAKQAYPSPLIPLRKRAK